MQVKTIELEFEKNVECNFPLFDMYGLFLLEEDGIRIMICTNQHKIVFAKKYNYITDDSIIHFFYGNGYLFDLHKDHVSVSCGNPGKMHESYRLTF